ncbi:hypothetical protein [Siminovitchia terrae]|uniref:hypothetical protein n=1 Tax=Siminovitchia terrae TaxID=1914933 RepID=UPI0028AB7149|nr:hypothetical protein [Siminovitchia terrae]
MEWGQFFGTASVVAVIVILQWPRMKDYSKRDKGGFIALLLIGLILSLFNLQHIKGPLDLEKAIFHPISRIIGK